MQLVRTIEIISYRGSGDERTFIYTMIKEFYDFKLEMIRRYMEEEEVETLVKTGNWHTITADLEGTPEATKKMAVQVLEYGSLSVPIDRFKESTVNRGEDEFSKVIRGRDK